MQRKSDLQLLGSGLDNFWKPNDKAEYAKKILQQPNTYLDGYGVVRCRTCHQPRMFYLEEAKRWMPCTCDCKEDKDVRLDKIDENKRFSGLEGIYRKADFDSYQVIPANEKAFNSCLRYALNFEKISRSGLGLYLYGESTDEKELLAACIANFLLDAGIQVFFVSVEQILSEIKEAFTKKISAQVIINKYACAELVILINLGMKKYSKVGEAAAFVQDNLYQIIDGRYIRQKPTIFTSSYTIEKLVEERGIMRNTVDRIAQMSTRKFELIGKSHRLERAENIPF